MPSLPLRRLWVAPLESYGCDGCVVAQNIIPSFTGAAKALGKVNLELNRKFIGLAFCVPTPNVSIVDLTCHQKSPDKYDDIKKVLKQVFEVPLKGILGYTEDQIFSCDFNNNSHSSTFDAGAGIDFNDNFVKPISWYDDEYGCNNRMVDLMASKDTHPSKDTERKRMVLSC
jgi:glyceraldehyde 3-phosphate dehydrogenase